MVIVSWYLSCDSTDSLAEHVVGFHFVWCQSTSFSFHCCELHLNHLCEFPGCFQPRDQLFWHFCSFIFFFLFSSSLRCMWGHCVTFNHSQSPNAFCFIIHQMSYCSLLDELSCCHFLLLISLCTCFVVTYRCRAGHFVQKMKAGTSYRLADDSFFLTGGERTSKAERTWTGIAGGR